MLPLILGALVILALAYIMLPSTVLISIMEKVVLTDNGNRQPPTPLDQVNKLDAIMTDHSLSVGSGTVFARLFQNPKNSAGSVLLYCAGRLTDVGKVADAVQSLLEAGHSVLAFDYPGVGRSTGQPTLRGMLQSGLAAYDYLHDRLGYDARRICIYGVSLGGWTAAHVSSHRDHINGALVLQSTGDDMVRIGKLQNAILRIWPSFLFYPRLNNVAEVKNNHRRYFGMHGGLDNWSYVNDKGQKAPGFPYECGEILARAANSMGRPRFFLLPNSSHQHVWQTDAVLYQNIMREVLGVVDTPEFRKAKAQAANPAG